MSASNVCQCVGVCVSKQERKKQKNLNLPVNGLFLLAWLIIDTSWLADATLVFYFLVDL